MKPTIGRIVHYTFHNHNDGPGFCAAIITRVNPDNRTVALKLLTHNGISDLQSVEMTTAQAGTPLARGRWSWPQIETASRNATPIVDDSDPAPESLGVDEIVSEYARQVDVIHRRIRSRGLAARNELAIVAAALCLKGTDAWIENGEPVMVDVEDDEWGLCEKYHNDRFAQLRVAGALIAAEIDRLRRKK